MHRDFNTAFWDDPWVQKLSDRAQHLYIYLANNSLCSACGVYEITLERITFDTKIDSALLPSLLLELTTKVSWNPITSIIWVKGFFRWQNHSPKFQTAAIESLKRAPMELQQAWLEYNDAILTDAPSFTLGLPQRSAVLIRDNFICQYCGKEITSEADFEVDHIIPQSRGGKTNYRNLVASCRTCNQNKMNHSPSEVGFPTPTPSSYHASQALYAARNNTNISQRLLMFPNIARYCSISTTSTNINQPTSTQAETETKVLGLRTQDLDKREEPPEIPKKESLSPLKGGAPQKKKKPKTFTLEKTQNLLDLFSEEELIDAHKRFPTIDFDWEASKCLDWHNAKGGSGNWKNSFRNWLTNAKPIKGDNYGKFRGNLQKTQEDKRTQSERELDGFGITVTQPGYDPATDKSRDLSQFDN